MSDMIDAAVRYLELGWQLVPLNGKVPVLKDWTNRAVRTVEEAERWWSDGTGFNVGVATGLSNLAVVDIDPWNGGLQSWAKLDGLLPWTMTVRTGSAGYHLYLRMPERRLRNTAGRLPGFDGPLPGIDLRADGGQVVAPPSIHPKSGEPYRWLDTEPLADAPSWMAEVVTRPAPRFGAVPLRPDDGYVAATLEGVRADMAAAGKGQRNDTLYRKSLKVARLVASGALSEQDGRAVCDELAALSGLPDGEAQRTVSSGWQTGITDPLTVGGAR